MNLKLVGTEQVTRLTRCQLWFLLTTDRHDMSPIHLHNHMPRKIAESDVCPQDLIRTDLRPFDGVSSHFTYLNRAKMSLHDRGHGQRWSGSVGHCEEKSGLVVRSRLRSVLARLWRISLPPAWSLWQSKKTKEQQQKRHRLLPASKISLFPSGKKGKEFSNASLLFLLLCLPRHG